mmetsp:Transcript_9383/g.14938  ORF Transcript_9383/g.14938 Transcript_9383/m.14938 type:complete len:230 (-) Transcript_9383:4323-5012(-)
MATPPPRCLTWPLPGGITLRKHMPVSGATTTRHCSPGWKRYCRVSAMGWLPSLSPLLRCSLRVSLPPTRPCAPPPTLFAATSAPRYFARLAPRGLATSPSAFPRICSRRRTAGVATAMAPLRTPSRRSSAFRARSWTPSTERTPTRRWRRCALPSMPRRNPAPLPARSPRCSVARSRRATRTGARPSPTACTPSTFSPRASAAVQAPWTLPRKPPTTPPPLIPTVTTTA